MRSVILTQQLPVRRPADLIANAVEVEGYAANVEPCKPAPPQNDGLHVEEGARITDGFNPKLMEFVKPAGLWTLGAEVWAHVVEPYWLRLQRQPGIEVAPHDGSRPLRPQRQRSPAAIAEGEHLFAHDVRTFTHAANKKIG